jgi:hypothetical protein
MTGHAESASGQRVTRRANRVIDGGPEARQILVRTLDKES